ncbi:DNA repair and recombination protein [Tieghemostelium lacteum]|uniref:DNA repair and recombination protein n=1 Tax=Tieghemostelium lacteum TaxID=361077 RepID=A0A151Z3N0_TIELA|nr:DNA repair and recombination protein [Tieghemostelium lacteum]|eukprot:KYQ88572.1 DNA repair and recombination protein [Tieghemostelium lacteum]
MITDQVNEENNTQGGVGQSVQEFLFGKTPFTEEEFNRISNELKKHVADDDVAVRPGPGGTQLAYLETYKVINFANAIFGFNGWSSTITELQADFVENTGSGKFRVGVTAIVRITLKDGTMREDIGYGSHDNPSKGMAICNAKKEAVSDAHKRAFRLFGNGLGNFLYDKEIQKSIGIEKKNKKKPPTNPLTTAPNTVQTTTTTPTTTTNTVTAVQPQPVAKPPTTTNPTPPTHKPIALSIAKPIAVVQQQPPQPVNNNQIPPQQVQSQPQIFQTQSLQDQDNFSFDESDMLS